MNAYPSLADAVEGTRQHFVKMSSPVRSKFWQATDVSARPDAAMMEDLFVNFCAPVPMSYLTLQDKLPFGLNLPWAEDHFQERVAGVPVNPGVTWEQWPWANAADTHRKGGKFNHNYMERYWPKHAGDGDHTDIPLNGIRAAYGDLNDVVNQIEADPLTRQAYLPVFFPEDTGAVHKGRVPCSLGYHFLARGNRLHCSYALRSCDIYRHFVDDLYLTARLMQWVSDQLLDRGLVLPPGILYVQISSLHCFTNDFREVSKGLPRTRSPLDC